jgi:hypothetical protein
MSTDDGSPEQLMSQLFEQMISGYLDDIIEGAAADETDDAILDVVQRIGGEQAKQLADDLAKITIDFMTTAVQTAQMAGPKHPDTR